MCPPQGKRVPRAAMLGIGMPRGDKAAWLQEFQMCTEERLAGWGSGSK